MSAHTDIYFCSGKFCLTCMQWYEIREVEIHLKTIIYVS
jgi:hypothetical protein